MSGFENPTSSTTTTETPLVLLEDVQANQELQASKQDQKLGPEETEWYDEEEEEYYDDVDNEINEYTSVQIISPVPNAVVNPVGSGDKPSFAEMARRSAEKNKRGAQDISKTPISSRSTTPVPSEETKRRTVKIKVGEYVKKTPPPQAQTYFDEDPDVNQQYFDLKGSGGQSHTASLRLRPDEAKRKELIVGKKNVQRKMNR